MLEVGNGVLADAEIPVRLPPPPQIEIIPPVKRQLHAFSLQLIHDSPVVNTPNRDAVAASIIIKMRSFLLDTRDINGADAQHFLREQEVGQRLLLLRMNLHENDVFRIMVCDDCLLQKTTIGTGVEPAQEII